MKPFPDIAPKTQEDMANFVRYVQKERKNDVKDFDNLNNVFISGRKVGKIPTGSSDIEPTDKIGDFNYDASYMYICIDNTGAEWRRVALSSW